MVKKLACVIFFSRKLVNNNRIGIIHMRFVIPLIYYFGRGWVLTYIYHLWCQCQVALTLHRSELIKATFPSILSSSKRSSRAFFKSSSAILLMTSENSRGFAAINRFVFGICLRDIVKWQSSIKKTLYVIFRSSHSIQIYHLKILSRHNSIVVWQSIMKKLLNAIIKCLYNIKCIYMIKRYPIIV